MNKDIDIQRRIRKNMLFMCRYGVRIPYEPTTKRTQEQADQMMRQWAEAHPRIMNMFNNQKSEIQKTAPSCPLRTPYHTDYAAMLRSAQFGSPMAYYVDRMWTSQPPNNEKWRYAAGFHYELTVALRHMAQAQLPEYDDRDRWDFAKRTAIRLAECFQAEIQLLISTEPTDGAYAD